MTFPLMALRSMSHSAAGFWSGGYLPLDPLPTTLKAFHPPPWERALVEVFGSGRKCPPFPRTLEPEVPDHGR